MPAETRAAMGQKAFAYYRDNYRRAMLLNKLENFLF